MIIIIFIQFFLFRNLSTLAPVSFLLFFLQTYWRANNEMLVNFWVKKNCKNNNLSFSLLFSMRHLVSAFSYTTPKFRRPFVQVPA